MGYGECWCIGFLGIYERDSGNIPGQLVSGTFAVLLRVVSSLELQTVYVQVPSILETRASVVSPFGISFRRPGANGC